MATVELNGRLRSVSAATTNGKVRIHKERYIAVEGGSPARVLPRYKRRRRKGGRERAATAATTAAAGDGDAAETGGAFAGTPPQDHSQVTEEDEEERESEEMKPLIRIAVEDLERCLNETLDHQVHPTTQHNDDSRTPGRPFDLSSSTSDHQLLLLRSADQLEENHERHHHQSTAEPAQVEKPTEHQQPIVGKHSPEDSQIPNFVEKPRSPWPGKPGSSDDPESSGPSKGQRRRENCLSCCRQFIAFLFSTVGSCCLLVAYTIFGGFVFQYLESQNEKETREDMKAARWRYVSMLWNITESFNVLYERNWTAEADAVLESFTRHVFQATKKKGWDGTDRDVELQWSFPGALLYSITVVTTIGYGHIAPKTDWGKVATIFYAIFGIPLTLFTITNLGSIMATAFRFVYHCAVCCVCCVARRRHRRRRRSGRRLRRRSRWRRDENRKRLRTGETTTMMKTTTTIDNDDDDDRGLRLMMMSDPEKASDALEASADFDAEPQSVCDVLKKAVRRPEDINKVRVPIYICLLLMLGYLGLGTLVFRLSEDWDPLICLYFCFITLSTIGFGDYVPGTLDKLGSEEKMVLCALYLVFGLATIAMCFDLIQEEAKNKLRHVGQRLGLLKKTDT